MGIITILLIAIGLSMDSFAVSVSNGLTIRDLDIRKMILIAFSLAIFQALMPLFGWLAGVGVENYIKEFDHWIAFILLSFIGGKMIYEGIFKKDSLKNSKLKIATLLGQSLATSIDAFAIGISFAFLDIEILFPVIIIGVITFIASIIGLYIGKYFGDKFGSSLEIFGGVVLVGIGLKILIEHIYFCN
jgi:putative Mn2+ efflux pump MntP